MTDEQMQFLKDIYESPGKLKHFMEWLEQGITEKDVKLLIKSGMIVESIGDGFVGGLRTIQLTEKGEDIAKSYCDACGCLPCDCHWGYE